jgi:flagellar assembly protein FliH
MKNIIVGNQLNGHSIGKYYFKPLSDDNNEFSSDDFQEFAIKSAPTIKEVLEKEVAKKEKEVEPQKDIPQVPQFQLDDNIVETLMKKVDELSTSLIKMEIQLEKQQKEFNNMLGEERENSYKLGFKDGEESTSNKMQKIINDLQIRYLDSIDKLNSHSTQLTKKIGDIQTELIHTSLAIAKEVIACEVGENSFKTAQSLAKELLKSIQNATKVTVKVNPEDYDFVKNELMSSENDFIINVLPDIAITKGGVVIYSDSTNLDGNVWTRYKRLEEEVIKHGNNQIKK